MIINNRSINVAGADYNHLATEVGGDGAIGVGSNSIIRNNTIINAKISSTGAAIIVKRNSIVEDNYVEVLLSGEGIKVSDTEIVPDIIIRNNNITTVSGAAISNDRTQVYNFYVIGNKIVSQSGAGVLIQKASSKRMPGNITVTDNTITVADNKYAINAAEADSSAYWDISANKITNKNSLVYTPEGKYDPSKQHYNYKGVTYEITPENFGDYIDPNGGLNSSIDDGDITISSGDDGIHADIKVLINNGTIKIDDSYEGIESTIITMNDGDVTVNSSDDGINASNGLSSGEMEGGPGVFGGMNGGERPTGDFQDGEMPDGEKPDGKMQDFNDNQKKNNDSTDSESEDDTDKQALDTLDMVFEMNGGKLYVNAGGDGLDSNGDVVMNGGTVTIDGPEDDGNGALDYNSSYKMNGGTLIAAGSSGMSMTPSEGQNSVNVYLDNTYSDTNIVIKDSQGNELVNYTPAKKFSSFVYSGSNLTTGETYTVYANGEQVETFTVNDTVTKAGNESAGRGSFGPQGGKMQKDVTANKQS